MFQAGSLTGEFAGYFGRLDVTVGDRDVSGLSITLRPGSSISGTVAWAGDPAPGDVSGLHAEPAHGEPWLGLRRGEVGRAAGSTFTIGGLLPGEYVLRFPWTVRSIEWQGRDCTYRPFDTTNGDISDVRVTFTTQKTQLSGSVRTDRGGTAEDAAVIMFPVDRSEWSGYGFSPKRIATELTSTSGTYRFTTLPGGDYYAIAVDGAFAHDWKDPAFLERASTLATRIAIDWGQSPTLDLVVRQVRR
jgi:hypothetical protein